MTRHEWVVQEKGAGRLDRYLAERLGLSRNRVHQLLAEGRVSVDGSRPRKSDQAEEGQLVVVEVPEPAPIEAAPEPIPLDVLYEDRDLAVIDKPAGLVTHPAPGHPTGTLVNALLHRLGSLSGIGGALRPGIVHRLDKDTSGLMVVAKSDAAHRGLSEALKD
ncbi:MAG: RluA family pseudouridine synthase, partial [Gemmatimonadetes bacterium]|nr:RluA family pseudouridine synthase [Gemmatimonadota bacterium]